MALKSEEVQGLEKQWELLKLELEQLESFYERTEGDEIHVVHDIQSLMSKMETGEYYK